MHTADTHGDTAPVYEVAIQRTLNSGIHRDHLALSVCVYTLYTLYIVYGCSDVYVYITSSAYAE